MPSFLLSKLKQAQPSMRRRLFLYMGALAALLLAVLLVALLLLGQLKSPRAETEKALTFQMGAFRSDMASLWRNVSVMGIHLSQDMTAIIEEQTSDFSSLNGDVAAVGDLQEAMLEPLCQYVRQTDCSGAFIMLGAAPRSAPIPPWIPTPDFMCSAATPSIPPAICCSTGAWRTSVVSIG